MKRGSKRILTTHTGSLPRPMNLAEMLEASVEGNPPEPAKLAARAHSAVAEIVARQVGSRVDVVSDGEQSKVGYSTYIMDRLTGFEGKLVPSLRVDWLDFPQAAARRSLIGHRPSCNGPIEWKDMKAVQRDIFNFKEALIGVAHEEAFMTAASPGVIAHFFENDYFPNREAYVERLADVMKVEYDAIHAAGFLLQVDCPDLAMSRHSRFSDLSTEEFLKIVEMHVQALNHAVRDIPADRMRMHLCWGNYEGPHHLDVPLKEIIGTVLKAKPMAISFEGANPRHEHEFAVFRDVKLPDDKIIMPGVVDTTTNFIEHPELVAQRIIRYAELVGRENVIAGSDCGFSTFARTAPTIEPEIAWATLRTLADGAEIASSALW